MLKMLAERLGVNPTENELKIHTLFFVSGVKPVEYVSSRKMALKTVSCEQ